MSLIANPPPQPLLNAVTAASGASDVKGIPATGLGIDLVISAVASVTVQVSNHPEAQRSPGTPTWQSLGVFTTSGTLTVPGQFNWLRLSYAITSGNVTARVNQ
ncbi:MAG: hypothetical protein OEW11_07840 [Nitrospirota bacterium]|nr:hypothetical protein [Nitrospirota bacterium]